MEISICGKPCEGAASYRCLSCPKEAYTFSLAQPAIQNRLIANWKVHGAPEWAAPILQRLGLTETIQILKPNPEMALENGSGITVLPATHTAARPEGLDLEHPSSRASDTPVWRVATLVTRVSQDVETPPQASKSTLPENQPNMCAPASRTAEVPAWRSPGSSRNILVDNIDY